MSAPEPPMVADLDTLRALLGAMSHTDDANLQRALDVATDWVHDRCMETHWPVNDVQYAILLLASRLYQRRKSPEGVSGFSAEGYVVRVIATDPDIVRLIERHQDMTTAGIG